MTKIKTFLNELANEIAVKLENLKLCYVSHCFVDINPEFIGTETLQSCIEYTDWVDLKKKTRNIIQLKIRYHDWETDIVTFYPNKDGLIIKFIPGHCHRKNETKSQIFNLNYNKSIDNIYEYIREAVDLDHKKLKRHELLQVETQLIMEEA